MWIDRKKFMPSAKWLRHNKYVPDQVWVWTNGYGAGWQRLEDFLSNDSAECSKMYAGFWAPIETPDLGEEDTADKPCRCTPPIVNITFGDVHFSDDADIEEVQARVTEAVLGALGQGGKEHLADSPSCQSCRHYEENCRPRWNWLGKYRCYEAKP